MWHCNCSLCRQPQVAIDIEDDVVDDLMRDLERVASPKLGGQRSETSGAVRSASATAPKPPPTTTTTTATTMPDSAKRTRIRGKQALGTEAGIASEFKWPVKVVRRQRTTDRPAECYIMHGRQFIASMNEKHSASFSEHVSSVAMQITAGKLTSKEDVRSALRALHNE